MMNLLSLNYLPPHQSGMFAVARRLNTVGVICFTPPPPTYNQNPSSHARVITDRPPGRACPGRINVA